MNPKVNSGIIAVAVCFVLGFVVYLVMIAGPGPKPTLTEEEALLREKLLQAVKNAKKGDRRELDTAVGILARQRGIKVTENLLPDFVSFLNAEDAHVQLLGATGLHVLESPKSKDVLVRYLTGKNFAKLQKKVDKRDLKPVEYLRLGWEIQASALAIWALGKVGDESVIPLVESFQEFEMFQFEWGSYPVEEALAELGAIETLCNIPPDAEEWKIRRAEHTLANIRDPNKASELMKTVRNENIAGSIRQAALSALGAINWPDVPDFLVGVTNDLAYDKYLRGPAAIAAGKTQNRGVEKPLLVHAQNPESDIRACAFMGLVLCVPEEYLDRWFETIVDPNEDSEFREKLAGMDYLIPANLLIDRREELYNCLGAADQRGLPVDKIRVQVWHLINRLFDEEASIVLSSDSSRHITTLKRAIRGNLERRRHPSVEELEKKVEERLQAIVKFFPDGSERKK